MHVFQAYDEVFSDETLFDHQKAVVAGLNDTHELCVKCVNRLSWLLYVMVNLGGHVYLAHWMREVFRKVAYDFKKGHVEGKQEQMQE